MQPNWLFPLPLLLSRPRTSHLGCQNSLLTNFPACWFPCPPPTPGQSCLLNALLEVGCCAGPAVVNQSSRLSWIALAYLPPQPTQYVELNLSRFLPTCCFLQRARKAPLCFCRIPAFSFSLSSSQGQFLCLGARHCARLRPSPLPRGANTNR